jgi:hypothetical protein
MGQLLTWTYTNQITSWLVHSWDTFGIQTNHMQTHIHKTHHGLDLGEATTFPIIVFSMLGHGTNTQMSFCPKTLTTLEAYNFLCTPLIEVRFEAKL